MPDHTMVRQWPPIRTSGDASPAPRRNRVGRLIPRPFAIAIVSLLVSVVAAGAQPQNPVYVDDSPRAWSLFQQAQQHTSGNLGQAARVYQELLDDYAMKLIPVSAASTGHFVSVRSRVLEALRENDGLLERYRQIEAARAEQMLTDGRVRETAITRSLTPAGLDALLQLAQRDLEAARFEAARAWLHEARQHSELERDDAIHVAFMSGLAARYRGDGTGYQTALDRLQQYGEDARDFRSKLRSLSSQLEQPGPRHGASPLHETETSDLNDLVAQEIWSFELKESLFRRTFDALRRQMSMQERESNDARRNGAYNAAAATVYEGRAFINEGHRVICLDRFTGREIWTHRTEPINDNTAALPQDLNSIAIEGRWLVTLTGHGYSDERSFNGGILCLDSQTGDARWSRRLDGLRGEEAYEDLFPHGAPIIHEGAVYVLARRVTQQQLTASYVVSFDLQSGALRWVRFLSSVGGLRRSNRRVSSPTIVDGDVYIANESGALARLDADTGEIRWLQQVSVAVHLLGEDFRPYEMPAPIVTGKHVVALRSGANEVLVVNRERGDRVQTVAAGPATNWDDPRYLLSNGRRIFAIGRDQIAAFDTDNLTSALWRFPPPAQSQLDDPPQIANQGAAQPPEAIRIVGRVQVVEQALIVPTGQGVLIIDEETGLISNQLERLPAGNPLAVDAQLLLASADHLDSYMSFDHAERMLRERIAAKPAEPGPAISLLQLARKVNDFELAMTAAEFALSAIDAMSDRDRGSAYREQFLDILLEASRSDFITTAPQAERLFAIVQSAARTPRQRVAYLLAYGDWLTETHLDRAVETYQRILAEDDLAQSRYRANDVTFPAATAASRRLRVLIEKHGQQVYAAQADFARLRLDQLRQAASRGDTGGAARTKADQFAHLSRMYPFADAATQAAREAAKAHLSGGDRRAAMSVMMNLYQAVPDAEHARQLLGQYTAWCIDLGWLQRAANVLGHVKRMHGNIGLVYGSNDAQRRVDDWLAHLHELRAIPERAQLGKQQGPARQIPATLVPTGNHHARARVDAGLVLLRNNTELMLLAAERLQPQWTVPLPGRQPRVLELTDDNVLLWLDGSPTAPSYAVMLDAHTGEQRWRTPALATRFGEVNVNDPAQREAPSQVAGRTDEIRPLSRSQVLPLVDDDQIIHVRGNGDVLAVRRSSPEQVRLERQGLLAAVQFAQLHDGNLILAGLRQPGPMSGGSRRSAVPSIVVVDPQRGEVRHRLSPRADVQWLAVGPLGTLACGTNAGIETFDLATGDRNWTSVATEAQDAQRAWTLHDSLIIANSDGVLHALAFADPGASSLAGPFDRPDAFDEQQNELLGVRIVNDSAYVQYSDRIVRYDETGQVIGADAISTSTNSTYEYMLFGRDRIALLRYAGDQPQRAGFQSQYTYTIDVLSESCRALGSGVTMGPLTDRAAYARMIDGWVLFSAGDQTIAVPFPVQ